MTTYDIGGVTVDRRVLLQLAALAGTGGALALSGCAFPTQQGQSSGGAKSATNPLGVAADAPLEFFNFEGGYGKTWPNLALTLYRKNFPKAAVKLTGGQQVQQLLQPRFVGGDPPDLTSAGGLDVGALVQQKQLTPLDKLLAAPSFDTPGKTVRETLSPDVAAAGTYNGKTYAQAYVYGVSGIWYSKPLMDRHGWTYPKTWGEMFTLCAEIKAAGLAPWTYQGRFPGYVLKPILDMAQKSAGPQVAIDIDNLKPNAWRHPAIVESAARFAELAARGFLLDGTAGLSHTQAQAYWAQGKAVFIPCGSWLESELATIAPKNLGMTVAPPPSLTARETLPFDAIQVLVGGDFIVPANGKNPLGGLELLRILLSKQAARNFSSMTKELTTVTGSADGLSVTTAFASRRAAIDRAGAHTLKAMRYSEWYPKLSKEVDNATGALMTKAATAAEWSRRCQQAADTTAKDATIAKYHR